MAPQQVASPPTIRPFMVLADLYTWSPEKAAIQLDLLKPVAEYELHQAQCGCYFFLMAVGGDQTTITLIESYDSRDYMFGEHRTSTPFQRMKDLETEHDTRSARPLTLIISACGGFVEGKCPSSVALSKQFYRITKMACNPDTRQDVITILVAYAEHAYENMGDVLSYMVALDTEDASVLVVFERYPTADLAKAAGSDEAARRAMDKLTSLKVAQETQEYQAVRGFLTKNGELI